MDESCESPHILKSTLLCYTKKSTQIYSPTSFQLTISPWFNYPQYFSNPQCKKWQKAPVDNLIQHSQYQQVETKIHISFILFQSRPEKSFENIFSRWCQNEVKVCEMRIILVTLENLLERRQPAPTTTKEPKNKKKSRKLAKCVVSLFILLLHSSASIFQNTIYCATSEMRSTFLGKSFAKSAVSAVITFWINFPK